MSDTNVEIPDFKVKPIKDPRRTPFLPERGLDGRITMRAFMRCSLGQGITLVLFMGFAFGWGKVQESDYEQYKSAEKARQEALSMKNAGQNKSKTAKENIMWEGDTNNLPSFGKRQNSLNMTYGYIDGMTPAQRAKVRARAEAAKKDEEEALAKEEAAPQAVDQVGMPQMPGMPGAGDPAATMAQLGQAGPKAPSGPTRPSAWQTSRKGSRLSGGTGLAKGINRGFESPAGKGPKGGIGASGPAFYSSNAGAGTSSAFYKTSGQDPAAAASANAAPEAARALSVNNAAQLEMSAQLAQSQAAGAADGAQKTALRGASGRGGRTAGRAAASGGRALAAGPPRTARNFAAIEKKIGQVASVAGKTGGSGPDETGSLMAGSAFDNSGGEGTVSGPAKDEKLKAGFSAAGVGAGDEFQEDSARTVAGEEASSVAAVSDESESKALTSGEAWDASLCKGNEIPDPTGKPECVARILSSVPAKDPSAGYLTASRTAGMAMGAVLALQLALNVLLSLPLSPPTLKAKRFVQGSLTASGLATAGAGAILMGMGNVWAGLPFAAIGSVVALGAWFAYPAVAGTSLVSVSALPEALMAVAIPFGKKDKESQRVKRSLALVD